MKFPTAIRNLLRTSLIGAAMIAAPAASHAGVFISVGFAPPALPVYVQPVCPGDGYLWNPGYWAYGPGGYYWVPGVWVQPPTVGVLWTPPYWGFAGGVYGFHEGYWGPHVGFYGGVNYGFGFGGVGFVGGRWEGGHFAYNTAVLNVGGGVHNTYVDRTVINVNVNHASFNGPGGVQARPSPQEMQAEHENHVPPTAAQQSHFQSAAQNKANFASANGGHPAMAAVQRPGSTAGAVAARGGFGGNQGRPAAAAAQARPAAASAARPETQARPMAQTSRPAAATQARPAAQSRPAAQPHAAQQAHPAPQAHAAPAAHGGGHEGKH